MNFDESVSYLYGLGNEVLAMKLGLANITTLLDALGNPQEVYFRVQVAGTNGKGSTCAFLESICRAAGIRTGLTTSPHLVSVTERVRINGREISRDEFAMLATRVREVSEALVAEGRLETVPTYFEQVTAIALTAFAEAGVELAILETGLGGRFDAITAARAGVVAITPVGLDHERILGSTRALIAAEKAAIIRPDTDVVIAPQQPDAGAVILEKCRTENVTPHLVDADPECLVEINAGIPQFSIKLEDGAGQPRAVPLGLAGRHQAINAKTAVGLAKVLSSHGFSLPPRAIESGLAEARHAGRLEFIGRYLLDGAHNADGAVALTAFVEEYLPRPRTLIFGAMRDKDLAAFSASLFKIAERVILTPVDNPRSLSAVELNEITHLFPSSSAVEIAADTADAIARTRNTGDEVVCIAGSLYLVGEAAAILRAENDGRV